MRNTHTSQKTNKCSTILFAGFFGIFSNSIDKNLLDAQISGYKKNYNHTKCIRYFKRQQEYNTYCTIITQLS